MIRMEHGTLEHFVTCGQMKLLEQRADRDGLSYYQMMENAGTQATRLIRNVCEMAQIPLAESEERQEEQDASKQEHVMIFCGNGNNGGDGFVVARLLAGAGYQVTVVLVKGEPKTEDARKNFELLADLPIKVASLSESEYTILEQRRTPELFVDAIFGTGFHGKMHGSALKAVLYINSCRQKHDTTVFALDIPSGLGGDQLRKVETEEQDLVLRADYTITFHARKPIHLQHFAKAYCGEILVADIGIDEKRLLTVEV